MDKIILKDFLKKLSVEPSQHNRWKKPSLDLISNICSNESLAKKPPILTQRSKLKVLMSNLGKKRSLETREQMSISQKERFSSQWWYGSVNKAPQNTYCEKWTPDLRERVRAFFGYNCIECGTPQGKTKLAVHHVWYNKRLCCDETPRSLVPLCQSCHSSTNHNREYWSNHFQYIIDTYYGGRCWLTKEEFSKII